MFLINTTPLGSHKTISDYAQFLLRRYIIPQFTRGCNEVHVIFDNPGQLAQTPKSFEHKRRDSTAKLSPNHCCDSVEGSTKVQVGKWRDNFLNCRKCKRSLVICIGEYLLSNVGQHLQPTQALYVAGAFSGVLTNSAWYVLGSNEAQPDPSFSCNAEETDTRLWLHARKSSYNRILILSPDTDIYHVGLPLKWVTQKEIIIQISAINSRQLKLLNLNGLI